MFESRRPDSARNDRDPGTVRLVVGNRRTASWSISAWLALEQAGVALEVEEIDLFATDARSRISGVSPSGRLPVLDEHGTVIWDSLAIMEWAAERAPALWPAHARRRAIARSIVAELHAGFGHLRGQLPLDWFARYRLKDQPPARVQVELHRVLEIWRQVLNEAPDQPFLFGQRPMLPDLALVPMAARLRTYGLLPREPSLAAYAESLLTLPALAAWFDGVDEAPGLPAPPPGVLDAATAAPATAGPAGGAPPAAERALPPAEAGGRRLEDIVARARERERVPAAPKPAAPAPQAPSVSAPQAPSAPAPQAPSAAPPRLPEPAPEPEPKPRGLPWLRRRPRAAEPPASGPTGGGVPRRRPPGRG